MKNLAQEGREGGAQHLHSQLGGTGCLPGSQYPAKRLPASAAATTINPTFSAWHLKVCPNVPSLCEPSHHSHYCLANRGSDWLKCCVVSKQKNITGQQRPQYHNAPAWLTKKKETKNRLTTYLPKSSVL